MSGFVTVQDNLNALNGILPEYIRVSGMTTAQVLVKKGYDLSRRISDRLKLLKPGKGSVTLQRLAVMKSGRGIGKGILVRDSIIQSTVAKYGGSVRIADRNLHTGSNLSTAQGLARGKRGIRGLRLRANKRNPEGVSRVTKDKKKLNIWQLIVQRELSARESGAGYTAWASMMNVRKVATQKLVRHFGRVRQELGRVGLTTTESDGSLTFNWGGIGHDGKPIQSGESLSKPRQQSAIATAISEARADIGVYLARKHGEALQESINLAISKAPMIKR